MVLGVKVLLFVDNRLVIQLTSHNDNLSRWFHHSVTSLRDLCLVSDRQAQWGGEKESGHGAGKEKKKKKINKPLQVSRTRKVGRRGRKPRLGKDSMIIGW